MMIQRFQRYGTVAAALALTLAACDDDGSGTPTPAERASAVRTNIEVGQAGSNQVLRAGSTARVVATVTDDNGQPVEGAPILWSGSGAVAPDGTTTGAQGTVGGTWTTDTRSGIQEVVATVNGGTGAFDRVQALVYADTVVGTLVLTAAADSLRRGSSLEVLVTDARDRYGNPYVLSGAQPNGPPPIEFSSLDPTVGVLTATRARSAIVTALAVGTARIVARSDGKADTVSVRVFAGT